jgi:hypothetical protein
MPDQQLTLIPMGFRRNDDNVSSESLIVDKFKDKITGVVTDKRNEFCIMYPKSYVVHGLISPGLYHMAVPHPLLPKNKRDSGEFSQTSLDV